MYMNFAFTYNFQIMFNYLVTYGTDKNGVAVGAKADFLHEVECVFTRTILTDAAKVRYEDPVWDSEVLVTADSPDLPNTKWKTQEGVDTYYKELNK